MKQRKWKRWLSIAAVTMLTLLGATAVYGQGSETIISSVGTDMTLKVDGNVVTSDVSPVIISDRMMVPARAVFESVGATVDWSADKPSYVGIAYNGTKVDLTINSKTAYVNGETKSLDVPAQLVSDRTLIPVRFVSEALGFTVDYSDASRTVAITSPVTTPEPTPTPTPTPNPTDPGVVTPPPAQDQGVITSILFSTEQDKHRITITADRPITSYAGSILSGPDRYAMDIDGFAWFDDSFKITADTADNNVVASVRAAQFTGTTVRVVADLMQPASARVSFSEDQQTMYIDFDKNEPLSKKPDTLAEVLIVIDPGHGGPDSGSQGKVNGVAELNEKDVNLDVATRLNQKLQAAGLKTRMTRTSDTFADPASANASEDLRARAKMANDWGATLCISIHNNSVDGVPAANGTETLYYDTDGKARYGMSSKELAELVQKKMIAYCGTYNRGAKNRPELGMLRLPEMPSIIVEGAFLSNDSDRELMKTAQYRENYANAVAEAVIEYLNQIYR